MTFLTLKGLTKRYDGASDPCVNGIDLEVDKGQIVVILGPSGSGKTTTLKMIAGLTNPTSGDVLMEENPSSTFCRKKGTFRWSFKNRSFSLT